MRDQTRLIMVRKDTKDIVKAQAALDGIPMMEWLDKIARQELTKRHIKREDRKDNGFF